VLVAGLAQKTSLDHSSVGISSPPTTGSSGSSIDSLNDRVALGIPKSASPDDGGDAVDLEFARAVAVSPEDFKRIMTNHMKKIMQLATVPEAELGHLVPTYTRSQAVAHPQYTDAESEKSLKVRIKEMRRYLEVAKALHERAGAGHMDTRFHRFVKNGQELRDSFIKNLAECFAKYPGQTSEAREQEFAGPSFLDDIEMAVQKFENQLLVAEMVNGFEHCRSLFEELDKKYSYIAHLLQKKDDLTPNEVNEVRQHFENINIARKRLSRITRKLKHYGWQTALAGIVIPHLPVAIPVVSALVPFVGPIIAATAAISSLSYKMYKLNELALTQKVLTNNPSLMAAVGAVAWDDLKTMTDEFFEWSKIEDQKKEFKQAKEDLCKKLLDNLTRAFVSMGDNSVYAGLSASKEELLKANKQDLVEIYDAFSVLIKNTDQEAFSTVSWIQASLVRLRPRMSFWAKPTRKTIFYFMEKFQKEYIATEGSPCERSLFEYVGRMLHQFTPVVPPPQPAGP